MRVNVYAEELTGQACEFIARENVGPEKRTLYGLRVFLASAAELHQQPDDDDRSAVTFWFTEYEHMHRFAGVLVRATVSYP